MSEEHLSKEDAAEIVRELREEQDDKGIHELDEP